MGNSHSRTKKEESCSNGTDQDNTSANISCNGEKDLVTSIPLECDYVNAGSNNSNARIQYGNERKLDKREDINNHKEETQATVLYQRVPSTDTSASVSGNECNQVLRSANTQNKQSIDTVVNTEFNNGYIPIVPDHSICYMDEINKDHCLDFETDSEDTKKWLTKIIETETIQIPEIDEKVLCVIDLPTTEERWQHLLEIDSILEDYRLNPENTKVNFKIYYDKMAELASQNGLPVLAIASVTKAFLYDKQQCPVFEYCNQLKSYWLQTYHPNVILQAVSAIEKIIEEIESNYGGSNFVQQKLHTILFDVINVLNVSELTNLIEIDPCWKLLENKRLLILPKFVSNFTLLNPENACKFCLKETQKHGSLETSLPFLLAWSSALEKINKCDVAVKKLNLAFNVCKNDKEKDFVRERLQNMPKTENSFKKTSSSNVEQVWLERSFQEEKEKALRKRNNLVIEHKKKKKRRPKRNPADNQLPFPKVKERDREHSQYFLREVTETFTEESDEDDREKYEEDCEGSIIDSRTDTYQPFKRHFAELEDREDLSEDFNKFGYKMKLHQFLNEGLSLSDSFVKRRSKDYSNKKIFFRYEHSLNETVLKTNLQMHPEKYKKCILKIHSAHHATCTTIDSNEQISIEISGRSKCGKNFSGDEVVVEILKHPDNDTTYIPRLQKQIDCVDDSYYGKVIGCLHSSIADKKTHPVFICEIDEEYHLMHPLCGSVPKFSVLHDKNKPFNIDIYNYDKETQNLEHSETLEINPAKKKNYLFLVVYLWWDFIYPKGAVIECFQAKGTFEVALRILELQFHVPILNKPVINLPELDETQIILNDLTKTGNIFTIDAQNCKDIDDALSIKYEENMFTVGVHIADVSSYVEKNSEIDNEAFIKATTFYPGHGFNPYHMLPQNFIENVLSLVPNQIRRAISIFLKFNNKKEFVGCDIQNTKVVSCKKFSYSEIQIILDSPEEQIKKYKQNPCLENDIVLLNEIAKVVRKKRLGFAMFSKQVSILNQDEAVDFEAHALVEEFMILANYEAAKKIMLKFPEQTPLRCQQAPAESQMLNWMKTFSKISNTILYLQNKPLPDSGKISLCNVRVPRYRVTIGLQNWVYDNIQTAFKKRKFDDIRNIIKKEQLHPEQCVAIHEWNNMQEMAVYKCYGVNDHSGIVKKMLRHYSLGIYPYIHFTSPIRRYIDIINHRLLKAALKNDECPYTSKEINQVCTHINEVSKRAKQFQKQCSVYLLGNMVKKEPLLLNVFIYKFSQGEINFIVPGMINLPEANCTIQTKHLHLRNNPKLQTQNDLDCSYQYATFEWNLRLYSLKKSITSPTNNETIRLDPNKLTRFDQMSNWLKLLKAITEQTDDQHFQEMFGKLNFQTEENRGWWIPFCCDTQKDVSSETKNGPWFNQFRSFSTTIRQAQVLRVQIGAEAERGSFIPKPQLLDLSHNVKFCLVHISDPVKYFSRYATKNTMSLKNGNCKTIESYLKVWEPLWDMESVTIAANENPFYINDIEVKMNEKGGEFTLKHNFKILRSIEFHDVSSVLNENTKKNEEEIVKIYTPVKDCVCIKTLIQSKQQFFDAPGDKRYYVAHGRLQECCRNKKSRSTTVKFDLNPNNEKPPLNSFEADQLFSVEIMSLSENFRRVASLLQYMIGNNSKLAKDIALGKKIDSLEGRYIKAGSKSNTHKLEGMPINNPSQDHAIKNALRCKFTLIQGPPGTGKTYTGIKLICLFADINKTFASENNKKQIVFCGPSNSSVDLVARLTKYKLGDMAPKMVRVYGSSLEAEDFPIPSKKYFFSGESKPDKRLKDITLHLLIRNSDRPYAEELKDFDSYFKKVRECPERMDVKKYTEKLKEYRDVCAKAFRDEIKHYDIIFCTTAVSMKKLMVEGVKVQQLIIDEAGMVTEPETIATIIAANPGQVVLIGDHMQLQPVIQCTVAGRLGLEKSLFERYKDSALMLKTQYRMHPEICSFVSKTFYNNELVTANVNSWKEETPLSIWKNKHFPHIFCNVLGTEEYLSVSSEEGNERSCANKEEALKVKEIYIRLMKEKIPPERVNILSQYNNQCYLIRKVLNDSGYVNANIKTVVKSQGGEWDYVIFSTVRSLPHYKIENTPTLGWCKKNLGFITDEHQINVALSRARKGLFIVGNENLLNCNKIFRDLIQDYKRKGCYVDGSDFPPKWKKHKKKKLKHK